MDNFSFFINGRFPGLNEYSDAERTHRMVAASMKKEYTDLVASGLKLLKAPKFKKVAISFEWYEPNAKRDPDNIVFAKKFILDGMVQYGMIKNDSQRYVLAFDDSWCVDESKKKKVGVLVSVVEYE